MESLKEVGEHLKRTLRPGMDLRRLKGDLFGEVTKLLDGGALSRDLAKIVEEVAHEVDCGLMMLGEGREIDLRDEEELSLFVRADVEKLSEQVFTAEELSKVRLSEVALSEIPRLNEYLPELCFPDDQVGYRGGVARVALRLFTGPDGLGLMDRELHERLLAAEMPLNDYDVLMTRDGDDFLGKGWGMGAGVDDIAVIDNWGREAVAGYMLSQDLTSNLVILRRDRMVFDQRALESMKDGKARCAATLLPHLYEKEKFYRDGREHVSRVVLYRMVRSVLEGKHDSFDLPRYNLDNVKLANYWLVILRKIARRADCVEMFMRMYSCAKQMRQDRLASDAVEFLNDLVRTGPVFNFVDNFGPQANARLAVQKYINWLVRTNDRSEDISGCQEMPPVGDLMVTVRPDTSDISESERIRVKQRFDAYFGDKLAG